MPTKNKELKAKYRRAHYLKNKEKAKKDAKSWQQRNRDRWMKSRRDHRRKLRQQVLIKLGNKCVRCGESDPIVLQVDHVNGDGRRDHDEYSHRAQPAYLKEIIADETGKYQLLCANCNTKKYFTEEKKYPIYDYEDEKETSKLGD
jgi:5-methylcytosine-specific restriction endonuclease McrA